METKLVRIGNSKGLRLPQSLIKQFDLENKAMELEPTNEGILIKPIQTEARKGWAELFKQATKNNAAGVEDLSVLSENDFDREEWTW